MKKGEERQEPCGAPCSRIAHPHLRGVWGQPFTRRHRRQQPAEWDASPLIQRTRDSYANTTGFTTIRISLCTHNIPYVDCRCDSDKPGFLTCERPVPPRTPHAR